MLSKDPPKYGFIDSLRGLAIILVLIVHNNFVSIEQEYFPKILKKLFYDCRFGVQLFFLISSFTLMLSHEIRYGESNYMKKFFVRRIFPMYYFAILYYTFQNFIGFSYFSTGIIERVDLQSITLNLLLLHGFSFKYINNYVPGGWSIAVEMTFYILFPLIAKFSSNINSTYKFFFFTLLTSIIFEHLLRDTSYDSNEFLYYNFVNQLPVFTLGVVLYHVFKKSAPEIAGYLLLTTAIVLCYFVYFFNYKQEYLIFSLMFCFLILSQSRQKVLLITNRITAYIGEISYSMYLTHFGVIHFMTYFNLISFVHNDSLVNALINYCIRYFLLIIFTILISKFTYTYIEVVGQHIGKKILAKF